MEHCVRNLRVERGLGWSYSAGGLRFLIVHMTPTDAEGRARGTIKTALEVKKGPRRSCWKLAGLITVCPLVGEQLGGLFRVPTPFSGQPAAVPW